MTRLAALALLLGWGGCVPAERPPGDRDAPRVGVTKPERAKLVPINLARELDAAEASPSLPELHSTFSDDFEREQLGADYFATGDHYRLTAGRLCVQGARNHPLWLRHRLPVNARISVEAESGSEDGDIKLEAWGDGQAAATRISYTDATSYLAIFGGWKNRYHVLARMDEHAPDRPQVVIAPGSDDPREQPVQKGRRYRLKLERSDGRTLRFWVDDVEILSFSDPQPLAGTGHDHFAFNDWDTRVCFDHLVVETLPSSTMNADELDVALEELETRLERLRALYEQYFMGLEKIEPSVARKDVDRRIYLLRREKIRNTAKRFKLQTIIQRYNTFQQYWQRICREIENGTYKRHLLKAQRKGELLTIAARKRLGRLSSAPPPAEEAAPATASSHPPAAAAGPAVASSHPPSAASAPLAPASPALPGAPVLAAAPAPAVAAPPVPAGMPPGAPSRGSPPIPKRPPLPSRPDVGGTARALSPVVAAPPVSGSAAGAPPAPPAAASAAKFESLDLDMDFMGDWDPGARKQAPPPKPGGAVKPVAPSKPASPAAEMLGPGARPLEARAPAALGRPASVPPAPVALPPRPASSAPSAPIWRGPAM